MINKYKFLIFQGTIKILQLRFMNLCYKFVNLVFRIAIPHHAESI